VHCDLSALLGGDHYTYIAGERKTWPTRVLIIADAYLPRSGSSFSAVANTHNTPRPMSAPRMKFFSHKTTFSKHSVFALPTFSPAHSCACDAKENALSERECKWENARRALCQHNIYIYRESDRVRLWNRMNAVAEEILGLLFIRPRTYWGLIYAATTSPLSLKHAIWLRGTERRKVNWNFDCGFIYRLTMREHNIFICIAISWVACITFIWQPSSQKPFVLLTTMHLVT
jgi:hypothetical protein